ncbi:MAG TPA: hypothetical protein VN213_06020 [Solirubrobacteraceae bacterium]|nr:hypothetical protein [Solirubrobacteraceae bacterium]
MGLLDDAIREHLDLKRRRGADPDEVARQEQEALGPPRRGEFAAAAGDPGVVPEFGDQEPEDEVILEPREMPAAIAEPEASAHDDEEPWAEAPPDERAAREQATTEFTPDDMDEEPSRRDRAEDVLEETPEFLQETPEHDRLWFEQRPPRDFDFDK